MSFLKYLSRTQRKLEEEQQELRLIQKKIRLALEHTNIRIWEYDINSNLITPEVGTLKMPADFPDQDLTPKNLVRAGYVDPECAADFLDAFQKMFQRYDQATCVVKMRISDEDGKWLSEYRWTRIRLTMMFDDGGNALHAFGVSSDASMEVILEDQAKHDPLTNLLNRRSFDVQADDILRIAKLNHYQCAFIIIDIDNFKQVNDTFGHKAGDIMLIHFADALRREFRADDLIGRIGGDEFVVLMSRIPDLEQVRKKADLVSSHMVFELEDSTVTCSAGISIYPTDGRNSDDLYRAADQRLYKAKDSGKARFLCPESDKPCG